MTFLKSHKTPLFVRHKTWAMVVFLFVLTSCILPKEDSTLAILKQNGEEVRYKVDIALTQAEQAKGLMHLDNMPSDQGMLFIDVYANYKSMWMKNTLIPLDMLFIDSYGQIIYIHKNAIPHDLTAITSPLPSIAVLEINAGQVDKHNIKQGDRIKDFKKFIDLKKSLE